ncbi:MAG: MBOAT family O-acyltransferase [Candidatus Peregrinibacteria bacterium]
MPIVVGAYALLPKFRTGLLLCASYIFYAWWNPLFVPLLLFSTFLNFTVGRRLADATSRHRKNAWLTLGLLINLSMLGTFKYYGFLAETLQTVFGSQMLPPFSIALPLGISFFTFEGISYLIDIRRGACPSRNWKEFALFVSFFPHLIAGPIIRFPAIATQFAPHEEPWREKAEGLYRFTLGISKKLLLADLLAVIADASFKSPAQSALSAWMGLFAYSFQIYLDFSAYTDMGIGLALLFGFRLPENFNCPYFSASATEFWRRWHMTLSGWFRDYVYIPLGGSRRSLPRIVLNIIITFTLSGLWHGARWGFVLWGLYYGILLALERVIGLERLERLPLLPRRIMTFLLVTLGWIFFRSVTMHDAGTFAASLIGWSSISSSVPALWSILVLAIAGLFVLLEPCIPRIPKKFTLPLGCVFGSLAALCLLIALGVESSPFIYFQF